MKIPIQREGAASPSFRSELDSPFRESKSSSSTYMEKKSVRITPKVTEVSINYPDKVFRPESNWMPTYTKKSGGTHGFPSSHSAGIDEFSALKVFDPKIRRWMRHDLDDIFTSSLNGNSNGHTNTTALKEKFDDFTGHFMYHHPIKVENFVAEQDQYVLRLNVQQFKPEELEVKITDDTVSITGKHEERQDDNNYNVQEYSRRHTLPPGVTADDVRCKFSDGGNLTITAPRKNHPAIQHWERTIPIQHHNSAIRA